MSGNYNLRARNPQKERNCSRTTTSKNKCKQMEEEPVKSDNSLPDFIRENISTPISDVKFSECPELQIFSAITSSIVETQFQRIFKQKSIDRKVCELITDHCNYKLAQIFNAATDYMKKCGRVKFTVEEFKKGLSICGENPNVLPSNPKKKKLKADNENQNICKTAPRVYLTETWLNGISPWSEPIDSLPLEVKKYFKAVTEILFMTDENCINMLLIDLQLNRNIFQLVKHFINFFYDSINRYKYDYIKIYVLLKLINAILRNPYIIFPPGSFNTLACMLIKFVASDLPLFNQDKDCWLLKDAAANIVGYILNRSKDLPLFFEVLYFIRSVLVTFENSLNSHYGALVLLNAIGVPGIFLILPSYIHGFHEHVRTILSSDNQTKTDVHMVQGQIILSYHILVKHYFKIEIKKPKFASAHNFEIQDFFLSVFLKDIEVFPIISQPFFSDYFGEALLPSFPPLKFSSHSSTFLKKKKKTNNRKI